MVLKVNTNQAIRNWDAYYENFLASLKCEPNETEAEKRKRIAGLEKDFEAWKRYYFEKYCYAPAASFHKKAARRELSKPELYECRPWARELAKDVVEMMITLYQALTGQKRNILFISNSYDKAAELLEPYRINLASNPRIINDYGYQQMPGSWAYGDFVTTQKVSFLAVGADQSPRGSRNEDARPDKVIISDIDTDEDCRNPEMIKKRWHWFEHAVFPTRSVSNPFQVIFLGNILAKDCCIVRAMEMADHVDRVDLEDNEGNSTWPEKNTPEHIARIKEKISYAAYMAEYKNTPLAEGTVFKEIRWDRIPKLKDFRFLVAYGDPSQSNKDKPAVRKGASYKALPLMGFLGGNLYIITCYLDQTTNNKFINWYYDLEEYVKGKVQIYNYVENNGFQEPFYDQVLKPLLMQEGAARQHYISVAPDERDKPDKFARIEGNLEPLNRGGRLIFNIDEENNPNMKRLEEQFKMIDPRLSSPADGPDAVEGGYWIINNKIAAMGEISTGRKKFNPSKRY